jgi:NtrC-family two-component system sensor histidine kinase KinB
MKIKVKLIIALSLLFLMILTLSGIAIRQVRQLGDDTKNILVANYQSLDYSRNMYKLLDQIGLEKSVSEKFQQVLDKQKINVTEIGEQELTADLQDDYNALLKDITNGELVSKVRKDINSIMKLNMDAIKRKSNTAEKTAHESTLWISLASAFCFIIGFTLIVNLPGYIANPIRDLTESIRQIASKNYSQRVYFKGQDEFAVLAKSFNTMAEKLQEYSNSSLEKIMMEKRRIETLISNLSDPVIGLDDNNNVLFINEEAIKVSGLIKEKVIGKKAEDAALYNDLLRSLLKQLAEEKPNNNNETVTIFSDNKESYFEVQIIPINITPTGEEGEKRIGSFIILKNITAYKELDAAKTSFIATVSHEFKTPIASIKMSLQLLDNKQTGELNSEQRELIAGIKEDAERLLRTTGELLNITQVETGKTATKIEACDVEAIITEAVEGNKAAAANKQIIVKTDIPTRLADIIADYEKTTWILSNLISNAIRYSHDYSQINISATTRDAEVFIKVSDNGIGIVREFLPKVFEKYFRVPGTHQEGTGLGLAISKEFMEAMGGEIFAESEPGKGSTFTLIFKRSFNNPYSTL